jgi:hypothetical protein
MLLHEANIIATKERAEMKMIEFFIAREIVVDGVGHSITKRRAPCSVTLPRGSQLEFVSRDESEVRVRYRGHQQSVPASDVDLR